MPRCGQSSQLGARSECLARHDARARKSGDCDGKPTKTKRKYKYESRDEANDAKKKKKNRARADWRRRTHKCLMAAEEKAHSKMQQRGGARKWKHAMKRRYNRDLQRQKQQRRRHEEVNH